MPGDLIITREFLPQDGGIAVIAYEMAKHLALKGRKVIVLAWDYPKDSWPSDFKDSGHPFTIVRVKQPANRWLQIGVLFFAALRCVGTYHVRRVWATSWNFSGVAAALLKLFLNIPYVVMTQGYEVSPRALTSSDQSLLKFCLTRAVKVFSISHFTKRIVEKWTMGKVQVEFIPHGVDPHRFLPGVDSSQFKQRLGLQGKKVLLTVARLFPRKGHDIVIEALPKIVEAVPDAVYLIVGVGPHKEILKKRIAELKMDPFVVFAGFVQDEELPACYAACDLFILPNREILDPADPWVGDFEGFGVVFVEAAACGKPVIAGKSGGAPDAIEDGVTGVLVDPMDKSQVADTAIRMLCDRNWAETLGAAGRRRSATELSWTHLIDRYEDLFKS